MKKYIYKSKEKRIIETVKYLIKDVFKLNEYHN
jgi:hypothetical protein